jgi:hypothetical protein
MDPKCRKKYKDYLEKFYSQNGGAQARESDLARRSRMAAQQVIDAAASSGEGAERPPSYQSTERPVPAARPTPAPRPTPTPRSRAQAIVATSAGPVEMIPSHSQLLPPGHGIHYLVDQEDELNRLDPTSVGIPPAYGEDNTLYNLISEVIDDFMGVSDYKILLLKKKLNLSKHHQFHSPDDLHTTVSPEMHAHLLREIERFSAKVICSKSRIHITGLSKSYNINLVYPNNISVRWYAYDNPDGSTRYITSEQFTSFLEMHSMNMFRQLTQRNRELEQRNRELEQRNRELEQSRRDRDTGAVMRCIAAPINQASFMQDKDSLGSEYLNNLKDLNLSEIQNMIIKLDGDKDSLPVEYSNQSILDSKERKNLINILDQEYNKLNKNDILITLTKEELLKNLNSNSLEKIQNIFKNNIDTIKLRRVVAENKIINFHTDFSQKTMQIALNNDSEYKGGKITFINNDGTILQPERNAGSYTIHNAGIVHGVNKLENGVRYSLFLCDTHNKQLEYLIQPVLNQFAFFKKATKFLEETSDIELQKYVDEYKNLLEDKSKPKINLDLGIEIVLKTHMLHPYEYNKSSMNFDMVSAIRRQEPFMQDILKIESEYGNTVAISKAIQEYNKFLELFKYGNKENLAPVPIVDLIWHTHQQFPQKYKKECESITGVFLDHDDSVKPEVIQKAKIEREYLEERNLFNDIMIK